MRIFFSLLFVIPIFLAQSQQKKTITNTKNRVVYEQLPNSLIESFKNCNAVDVVLFANGKSLEFDQKNAQLPISFVNQQRVVSIEGLKQIGIIMYKIDGKSFIDGDILSDENNTKIVLRLKTQDKKSYYCPMSVQGIDLFKQWLK